MSDKTARYTETLTAGERVKGELDQVSEQRILSSFKEDGILLLENVFDDEFVSKLYEYYMLNYGEIKDSPIHSSYKLDHERYFVVPRITSLFNDMRFYANPVIVNLLSKLLGPNWKYQSITTVMSYPGSKAQGIHLDAPLLFNSEEISISLPTYALTVVLPLVETDSSNGGTRVWPGSHLKPHTKNGLLQRTDPPMDESIVMQAKRGDCFMMDYRITHGGEPNTSQSVRPIVTFICTLPWFHDGINYEHIPEVIMTPADIQNISPEYQKRFNLPKFVELYSSIGDKKLDMVTQNLNENTETIDNINKRVSRNDPCSCGSGVRYKHCHGKV